MSVIRVSRSPFSLLRLAVPVMAASLALTACGGGSTSESDGPTKVASSTPPPKPEIWPLTGLEAPIGTTTKLPHPPMVVKMDNTGASAPQRGLDKADMVVEELVEGGLTRLAAFYYQKLPREVGPVRSMRASDIGIVRPVKADIVTSGAAWVTIQRIKKAGITFFQEGATGIYRESSRRAPYNVFTNLKQTAAEAKRDPETVPNYFAWGTSADYPGTEPVTEISVPFSRSHTTRWKYDGTHYVNTNSNAAADEQFKTDSVLVLRVAIGDAGYLDPANNPVPETRLRGTGKAFLFHAGKVVRATWTKPSLDGTLTLSTDAGPLTVPAGHTWVELIPSDGDMLTMTP